jgi:hypothetical protein
MCGASARANLSDPQVLNLALLDDSEASDVVAYLVPHRSALAGVAAYVSFISAAGGRR